jgi:hypothetical protein
MDHPDLPITPSETASQYILIQGILGSGQKHQVNQAGGTINQEFVGFDLAGAQAWAILDCFH